jgi:tRNA(adenine34) deaminase
MSGPQAFDDAAAGLHPAFRRSLELAYASLASGGLAVGAVLTDASGLIVAEGRNRAYDPPGGPDVLQGTPLAHAEMNVLAAVSTDRDLGDCVLWSTQEPCSMCAAAAAFTGVRAVRHLAPDPWSIAVQAAGLEREAAKAVDSAGQTDQVWMVTANVLFLLAVASAAGTGSQTVTRNQELEPETAAVVLGFLQRGNTASQWTRNRSLDQALRGDWEAITRAAAQRRVRTSGA